jgi:hypothetical protein
MDALALAIHWRQSLRCVGRTEAPRTCGSCHLSKPNGRTSNDEYNALKLNLFILVCATACAECDMSPLLYLSASGTAGFGHAASIRATLRRPVPFTMPSPSVYRPPRGWPCPGRSQSISWSAPRNPIRTPLSSSPSGASYLCSHPAPPRISLACRYSCRIGGNISSASGVGGLSFLPLIRELCSQAMP